MPKEKMQQQRLKKIAKAPPPKDDKPQKADRK